MKYKVGDKVKVRSWEEMEKQYGLDFDGDINISVCFVKSMREYCGKILTINRVCSSHYNMAESFWNWTDEMLKPANETKIVITTDGVETLARLYDGDKVVKKATAKCSPEDTFDFNVGAKLAFERLMKDEEKKPLTFREKLKQEHPEKLRPEYGGGCYSCPHKYGYEGKESRPCKEHSASCTECWDRAIPEDKAKKKEEDPPKYYNGKVVCVGLNDCNLSTYTVGKIYQFVDGQMTCDDGGKIPSYKHVKNFEEWDEFSSSDFVEIVE